MPPHTASVQDRLHDPSTADPSAGVNATNPWATAPRPDASERYANTQPTHEGVRPPNDEDDSEYGYEGRGSSRAHAYPSPANYGRQAASPGPAGGQFAAYGQSQSGYAGNTGNVYGRYEPSAAASHAQGQQQFQPPTSNEGRRFLAPAPPMASQQQPLRTGAGAPTPRKPPPLQATHSSSSTEPLRPTAQNQAYVGTDAGADKDTYTASGVENPHKLTQEEILEEEEMLRKSLVDWGSLRSKEFWLDKSMIKWYIATVLIIVLVVLMTFLHKQIINWLTPVITKFRALKAGWLIPIAILFVLSFPPLFGNEIVLILVGVVWGLGEGFGIAAAGTILGEVANFIVFKYWCRGRAQRIERKNLTYACLSRVLRDGGFLMCWLSRLSVIPTHFTTIVYSVCGFSFWKFCLALVAGLPKQLINVYVGVVLAGNSGSSTNSRVVSDSVFAVTAVVSLVIGWYIYRQMSKVRIDVWREQRDALKAQGVPNSELPPDVDARGYPVKQDQV